MSPGSRIAFMTEDKFIRNSIKKGFWDDISVLMIDEAHERNLLTDIILGLAKL